jgi:Fur family peroxide stress response transcriptional regulator
VLNPDIAYERMRSAGLRLTAQRRAVVEALSGDTSHPTAESVLASLSERVPGMSLSTVYKVLHELAHLGLVRELETPRAMRFDPEVSDHVHVICDECGLLFDAPLPISAARAIVSAASASGVRVSALDVMVRGVCTSCDSERARVH